jgi:hypothetical protein
MPQIECLLNWQEEALNSNPSTTKKKKKNLFFTRHKWTNIVGFHLYSVSRVVKFVKTNDCRDWEKGGIQNLMCNVPI